MLIRTQLKTIFNSWTSEISIFLTMCCLISIAWQFKIYHCWTEIGIASAIIEGVILTSWMIWAAYIIFFGKTPNTMPLKSRLIVEAASGTLFLAWLWITNGPLFAMIWLPFMIWLSYRNLKEL